MAHGKGAAAEAGSPRDSAPWGALALAPCHAASAAGCLAPCPRVHRAGRCAQTHCRYYKLAWYTTDRRVTRISLGIGPAFLPAAGNCLATREVHLGLRVAAAPAAPVGDVRARQPRRTGPSDAGGRATPRYTTGIKARMAGSTRRWDSHPGLRFSSALGARDSRW